MDSNVLDPERSSCLGRLLGYAIGTLLKSVIDDHHVGLVSEVWKCPGCARHEG
jgi:hypothetical protein